MKNEFASLQQGWIDEINEALAAYIAEAAHPASAEYEVLRQAMAYSMGTGGKRLRPLLTLEFAHICGGSVQQAMPLACAVEMVHSYSLIHDDLPCMDNSDLRRGKPSCHKQFGYANAMLAGDALLTLAFETIASAPTRAGTDVTVCLKAAGVLARQAGMDGMVGGQVMDLANENQLANEAVLKKTYSLKTAALLQAACQMGALSAGADLTMLETAEEYAQKLGLAFQIVDDILDVAGDEQVTGKPVGGDASIGKATYVTLLGLDEADRRAESATNAALAAARKLPDSGFLVELTRSLLRRNN